MQNVVEYRNLYFYFQNTIKLSNKLLSQIIKENDGSEMHNVRTADDKM